MKKFLIFALVCALVLAAVCGTVSAAGEDDIPGADSPYMTEFLPYVPPTGETPSPAVATPGPDMATPAPTMMPVPPAVTPGTGSEGGGDQGEGEEFDDPLPVPSGSDLPIMPADPGAVTPVPTREPEPTPSDTASFETLVCTMSAAEGSSLTLDADSAIASFNELSESQGKTPVNPDSFAWFMCGLGEEPDMDNPLDGEEGAVCVTEPITADTVYICRAIDSAGKAGLLIRFEIIVEYAASEVILAAPAQYVKEGEAATLDALRWIDNYNRFREGEPLRPVSYAWFAHSLADWADTANPIPGADGSAYTLPAVNADASYVCMAVDEQAGTVLYIGFEVIVGEDPNAPTPLPTAEPTPVPTAEPTVDPVTPVPTEDPVPTADPGSTTAPMTPVPTVNPVPTEDPVSTGEPGPTQKPEQTASPTETAAPADEPTPPPTVPDPQIVISEDGKSASVRGDVESLYVRVALILDSNGTSGLYVTQGEIRDGVVTVPSLAVPGLTVTGVNIALVRSIDDIPSRTPSVVATASKYL